jgi:ketosteroid isomerase-like protein
MDKRLQTLIDHFEIREVIEAYVHACDRGDRDAVADVYESDSWDDHGPLKCNGHEFADQVIESLHAFTSCNHLLGQSRIRVNGDEAGAETLFHATLTRDEDGQEMLDQMVGRYVDRLVRRDGVWRIKDRQCVSEWTGTTPLMPSFLAGHLFIQGQRSKDDPSYSVLGLSIGSSRIRR